MTCPVYNHGKSVVTCYDSPVFWWHLSNSVAVDDTGEGAEAMVNILLDLSSAGGFKLSQLVQEFCLSKDYALNIECGLLCISSL